MGALLALELTRTDLWIIAIIGIILLIGIVEKNAIVVLDFAIAAERVEGKNIGGLVASQLLTLYMRARTPTTTARAQTT